MARDKKNSPNISLDNIRDYPNGKIRDNDGSNNGTPVNEYIYGDIHEFFAKIMREGQVNYNSLNDNETNGYQLVEALKRFANVNDYVTKCTIDETTKTIVIDKDLNYSKSGQVFVGVSQSDFIQDINLQINPNTITKLQSRDQKSFSFSFRRLPLVKFRLKKGDFILFHIQSDSEITATVVSDQNNANISYLETRLTQLENYVNSTKKIMQVFLNGDSDKPSAIVVWGYTAQSIPNGWEIYTPAKGRFLIGQDSNNPYMNFRNEVGYTGGRTSVSLTQNNLPSFSYKNDYFLPDTDKRRSGDSGGGYVGWASTKFEVFNGQAQAFDIVPPYMIVHYIRYTGRNTVNGVYVPIFQLSV